jgi:hypothetical protein
MLPWNTEFHFSGLFLKSIITLSAEPVLYLALSRMEGQVEMVDRWAEAKRKEKSTSFQIKTVLAELEERWGNLHVDCSEQRATFALECKKSCLFKCCKRF